MSEKFVHREGCFICGKPGRSVYRRRFDDEKIADFLRSRTYPEGFFDDVGDAAYQLLQCGDCALTWQAYVLAPEFEKSLYDEYLDMDYSLEKKEGASYPFRCDGFRHAVSAGLFFGGRPRDLDFLEIGMGWGFWTFTAKAVGYNAVGLELSDRKVAYARSRSIRVISDLTGCDERFHYIHAEEVLEHLSDVRSLLSPVLRSLRRGGVFFLTVPNGNRLNAKPPAQDWKPKKVAAPLEHINVFSREALVRLMADYGVEPMTTKMLATNALDTARLLGWHPSLYQRIQQHRTGTRLFFRKT